jgi:ankyrin repeat protein
MYHFFICVFLFLFCSLSLSHTHTLLCINHDLTLPQKDGYTAMYLAAEKGQNEAIKLLLEHGVDVEVQEKVIYILLACVFVIYIYVLLLLLYKLNNMSIDACISFNLNMVCA